MEYYKNTLVRLANKMNTRIATEKATSEQSGNRHLRLSERAATEAPVHQQGARHDVDARRQSRGLPGLRFEGAVHE